MADIQHKLEIRSPRARVYEALSTQDGLAQWWTKDTKAEPSVGAVAEFSFVGGKYVTKMKIDVLDPGKRVAWTCVGGSEEWLGTTITFDLSEENGETVVRFGHRGWREPTDFLAHCSYRWAYFLRSLKLYLQEGKGTPHPDDKSA
jgi:uncharacterized protein YndB with AHSA1/START domain